MSTSSIRVPRRWGLLVHRSHRARRATSGAGLAALLALLSGCASLGSLGSPEPTPAPTVDVTLTETEAETAMKDYDARHNTAYRAASTSFDPVPWSKADTGMLYARRRLDTAVRKVAADRRPFTVAHSVRSVYAPAVDGGTQHAVVVLDRTSGGRTTHVLGVLTRSDDTAAWLMTALVRYTLADLPKPLARGSETTLTDAERAAILGHVRQLTAQLNAGKGPLVTGELANLSGEFVSHDGKRPRISLWSTEDDQFGPRGSLQAVKVSDGGTLVVASLVADTVHEAQDGESFDTTGLDNPYLRATGQHGRRLSQLRVRNGVTAVLHLDATGAVQVLAADAAGLPLG